MKCTELPCQSLIPDDELTLKRLRSQQGEGENHQGLDTKEPGHPTQGQHRAQGKSSVSLQYNVTKVPEPKEIGTCSNSTCFKETINRAKIKV